jgi:large subunit ribosomal protein L21
MKYAIVESGGKQYKAVEGETIEVDRLPVEIGENIKFEQVLLLVDGDAITVGTPLVKDTPVWTTIVEHFRGEKVTIFNYRPKKRIRVKIGHRQNYTRLLVEQIGGSTLVKKEVVKKVEPVEEKPEAEPKAAKKAAKAEVEAEETKKPAKKAAEKPAPAKAPKAAPKKTTTKAAPAKTTKTTKTPAKKSASK